MMTRKVAVLGVLALGACLDEHAAQSPETSADLGLPGMAGGSVCYRLRVDDANGGAVWSTGDSAAAGATRAEAAAAGAHCVDAAEGERLVTPCEPGAADARLWVVGVYDATGAVLPDAVDSCGDDGCALAFTCVADASTRVDFAFTLVNDAPQGFVDIATAVTPPARTGAVCYALRVTSDRADGQSIVWSKADVCSDEFGDGATGSVMFVGTCDSRGATYVDLWVEGARDATGAPLDWTAPCPTEAGFDVNTASGGCRKTVPCETDVDTVVTFDLR